MLYSWRSSFSGLELHASYDWQATAPITHQGFFPVHHFFHVSNVTRKPLGACNSTTHPTTSLPQDALFHLEKAKAVTTLPAKATYIHTVLLFCAQVQITAKLRVPMTALHIK